MIDDENRIPLFNPDWLKSRKVQAAAGVLLLALLLIFMIPRESGPAGLPEEKIQELGEILQNGQTAGERKTAAVTLGQDGNGNAVPALIAGLSDENDYVQQASRGALVRIGEPAVVPLVEELKSEFKDVRNFALSALMDITGQYFGSDYEAWSKWAASGDTAEPTAEEKETVELIKKLLSGQADWVYDAMQELKKKKNDAAYTAIIEVLDNSGHDVPKWAAAALGEMGGDRAVEALILKYRKTEPAVMPALERAFLDMGMKGVEALAVLLGDREHANVPLYAAQTLSKRLEDDFKDDFAGKRSEWKQISDSGIAQLSKLLEYDREGVRAYAAEILGRTGSDRAVDSLLACLDRTYPKQSSRSGAFIGMDFEFELIRALGNLGSRKASDSLNSMLRKEQNKKKRYNLPSLRQIVLSFAVSEIDRDTDALDYLLESLERGLTRSGRDKGLSEWAAYLLIESTLDVADPLIRSLSVKDDKARELAAWVLGLRKETEAEDALVRSLKDEKRNVRAEAVTALGRIGTESGFDSIAGLLDADDDMFVRRAACYALGGSGNKKYIEPLINILNDEHQDVRYAAHTMLEKLTGEHFRSQSYDTWKKWFLRTKGM